MRLIAAAKSLSNRLPGMAALTLPVPSILNWFTPYSRMNRRHVSRKSSKYFGPERAKPPSFVSNPAASPLEHGDEDAVADADRQEVHRRRLQRHEHRSERDHEQQERHEGHCRDHR